MVDLVDDDPDAVGVMLNYFYSFQMSHFPDQTYEEARTLECKVYAIADKYGCSELKELAKDIFAIETFWFMASSDALPAEVVQQVYASTPETDRGLRDVCCGIYFRLKTSIETQSEEDRQESLSKFEKLVQAVPAYAVDIAMYELRK